MAVNKHIILLVFAILVATNISYSQTFFNIPNDTIQMTGMMEDLETLSIQQINNSSNTIQLKWKKVSQSVPANWEASVCDNAICYTSLVNNGTMNPVTTGDYGLLLLHITPHVNYGTAIIRYAVWDTVNAATKDTLTYILTVDATSGISAEKNKKTVNIFPNPAKENINIISNLHMGFQFLIRDVSGKEMLKGISKTNSNSVTTELFLNGVYSVLITVENKIIDVKKIIIQH